MCHERGHFHLVALPVPMISSDDRGDRRDATLLRTSSRHAYYMRSSDTVRCALTEGRQGMRGKSDSSDVFLGAESLTKTIRVPPRKTLRICFCIAFSSSA